MIARIWHVCCRPSLEANNPNHLPPDKLLENVDVMGSYVVWTINHSVPDNFLGKCRCNNGLVWTTTILSVIIFLENVDVMLS